MILQSQKDPRWAKQTIGTCKDTFAQSGCKITCLASIAGITPLEVNKKITYTNGCLTVDERNAKELGLEYAGRTIKKPQEICIAETNKYAPKVPQHFFIYNPQTDEMADPLTYPCVWKKNKYPIVSYRLIFNNNETMKIPSKLQDEIKKYQDITKTSHKFGDNLDDKDLEPLKELMSEMRNQRNEFFEAVDKLKKLVDDTNKANDILLKERQECYDAKQMYIEERDQAEKEVQALENAQQPLRDEVVRLTALVEKNAKDTSILDALSFLLKSILNR